MVDIKLFCHRVLTYKTGYFIARCLYNSYCAHLISIEYHLHQVLRGLLFRLVLRYLKVILLPEIKLNVLIS